MGAQLTMPYAFTQEDIDGIVARAKAFGAGEELNYKQGQFRLSQYEGFCADGDYPMHPVAALLINGWDGKYDLIHAVTALMEFMQGLVAQARGERNDRDVALYEAVETLKTLGTFHRRGPIWRTIQVEEVIRAGVQSIRRTDAEYRLGKESIDQEAIAAAQARREIRAQRKAENVRRSIEGKHKIRV
jgi:hypothetical protein